MNKINASSNDKNNSLGPIFTTFFKFFFLIRSLITILAVLSIILTIIYDVYKLNIIIDNYFITLTSSIYLTLQSIIGFVAFYYLNKKQKENYNYNGIKISLFFLSLGIILFLITNYMEIRGLIKLK